MVKSILTFENGFSNELLRKLQVHDLNQTHSFVFKKRFVYSKKIKA